MTALRLWFLKPRPRPLCARCKEREAVTYAEVGDGGSLALACGPCAVEIWGFNDRVEGARKAIREGEHAVVDYLLGRRS